MNPTAPTGPAEGSHRILLNGSEACWRIEDGGVDVFAVRLVDGVPAGAYHPLCRLGAGQSVLGLGRATAQAPIGLLAVCLPQTRLAVVPEPWSLQASAVDGLDGWLLAVTHNMPPFPPRAYRDGQPGTGVSLAAGESLYSAHGVLWIDAAQAPGATEVSASAKGETASTLSWMPANQAMPAPALFPLTPTTWATAPSPCELTPLSSAEVLRSGRFAASLAAFHGALLKHLAQRLQQAEDSTRHRLSLKQRLDEQMFGQALAGLGQVLATTEEEGLSAAASASHDALTQACALVMKASGITAELKPNAQSAQGDSAIENLAQQARAAHRAVTLSGDRWWQEDNGPLLAFRAADGAPLALLPAGGQGYWMVNPAEGTRQRLNGPAAAGLSPTAFMFQRTFPAQALGMPQLLRFGLAGTGRDALRVVMVGALGGLLGLTAPLATGLLVNTVIPNAEDDELLQLVLLLLTAAVGVSAFELTRAIAMMRIDARVGNATQAAIMHRLLHLPARFFRDHSAADLAQRAAGIAGILHLLTNTLQSALLAWVFGLFSFVYLFLVNVPLALLATAVVAVALAVTVGINGWRLALERQMFQVQGENANRVFQLLNGIAKIRASGAEKRAFAKWTTGFSRQKALDYKVRRLSNALSVFNAGYVVLTSMLLFAAVAFFMPGLDTGHFLSFSAAFSQFFAATLGMTSALTASLNAIPLYERAKPILQALPEVHPAMAPPGELSGAIEINQVIFRYAPDGPLVLDDVSVRIRPGEFVAFVGPSGSGKSTLFRMLLGFEKPQSGAIYYDQKDLAGLDVGAVRRQLGVVLQNGQLMPGDLFTNIVGAAPLTLDDAWDAARMAGLDADIQAMPMGMHTFIGEGASTLSGGQKQRLMIARALAKKPRVLLFDEATSALDNRTQAIVAQSMQRLNATRIVIAHRLSTVVHADRIFVIHAGKVVEQGRYAELMALDGHFAALAKRQIA
jgi:ATP-binding cassette subfamily C protein